MEVMLKIRNAVYVVLGVAGVLWYVTLIPQDYRNWQVGYEEKNLWDEIEHRDTVAAYQGYVERYPSGRYVDQAQLRVRGKDFQELWTGEKIELVASSLNNREIIIRVQRKSMRPLTVSIPAGTSFVSDEDSQPSLVSIEDSAIRLSTSRWYSIAVPVVCLSTDCPKLGVDNRFTIHPNLSSPIDSGLIGAINRSDLPYSTKQAVVWIATEDPGYSKLSSTALLKENGSSHVGQIDQHAALVAMRIYDSAGLDITQKNIWRDRYRLISNDKDLDLTQWAKKRAKEAEQIGAAGIVRALIKSGIVSAMDVNNSGIGQSYIAPAVDFTLKSETTIHPILDGVVKEVMTNEDGGKKITIASMVRGQSIDFTYENIRWIGEVVKPGQIVKKSDVLGTSGVSNSPTVLARCNGQRVDPSEYLNVIKYRPGHGPTLESGAGSASEEVETDDHFKQALAKAIDASYSRVSEETRDFLNEFPAGKSMYGNLILALAWADSRLNPFYKGEKVLGIMQQRVIGASSRLYLQQKNKQKNEAQLKDRHNKGQDSDELLLLSVQKGVIRGALYFDKRLRYVLEQTDKGNSKEATLLAAIAAYKEGKSSIEQARKWNRNQGMRTYVLNCTEK